MTIIRQKKEKDIVRQLTIGLSIGAACTVLGGMFFYNQVVNNSHEITARRGSVREAEVRNAELKTALYALTDTKTMQEFAANNGLVVEKNPGYVKRQEVSLNL